MSLLAAAATALTITIRVYDLYGLPPDQRAEALAVAGETLAHAGVAVTWLDRTREPDGSRPPACLALLTDGELVVRIQARSPRGPHVLGTAVVQADGGPNVFASVYAGSVADKAARSGVWMPTLLGRATAHEIGHLLLGENAHGPHGLMRASWNVKRQHPSEWRFTEADADRIRQRHLVPTGLLVAALDE
jgi:hypothetical protein